MYFSSCKHSGHPRRPTAQKTHISNRPTRKKATKRYPRTVDLVNPQTCCKKADETDISVLLAVDIGLQYLPTSSARVCLYNITFKDMLTMERE